MASQNRHAEVVRRLIEARVDVNQPGAVRPAAKHCPRAPRCARAQTWEHMLALAHTLPGPGRADLEEPWPGKKGGEEGDRAPWCVGTVGFVTGEGD